MRTIRIGVFETNSSSTHSFTTGYGIILRQKYFRVKPSDFDPETMDEDDLEELPLYEYEQELNGIGIQPIGEESESGYLLYVKELTDDDLNKGKIPEITEEDKSKLDKALEYLEVEKNEEYQWHTASYFCSMCWENL